MLDRRIASAFYGDFLSLRPAQQAVIEPLTAGRDVVLCSGTGSGKTEAALAPLVSRYLPSASEASGPIILYVAPTKALINDLERRVTLPLSRLGWKPSIRHGDRDHTTSGKAGQLLITTPESLEVLLFRGGDVLRSVVACVIDEAHLLYNSQRGLQLAVLLRRLENTVQRSLQLVALSATVGNLEALARFLMGAGRTPDIFSFPSERTIDAQVRRVSRVEDFGQLVRRLTSGGRVKLLCFANARRECERLVDVLRQSRPSCTILTHYSSLSPEERKRTEGVFLDSDRAICVATSTLELGIDIGDIDAVVLWGAPGAVESLLQRIGRGNRRSSKTNLIGLVPDTSERPVLETLVFLAQIAAARAGTLSQSTDHELYGALGQQCLAMIGSRKGAFTRVADMMPAFSGLRHVTPELVEQILEELASEGICQRHGFLRRFGAAEGLHELVDMRLIYSNIRIGAQEIEIRHGGAVLGTVPRANLMRVRPGVQIRFAGRRWRVSGASAERIEVEPARGGVDVVDLLYGGRAHGMDSFVASLVWKQLQGNPSQSEVLEPRDRDVMRPGLDRLHSAAEAPALPFADLPEGRLYVTCAGHVVNKVIARHVGENVESATDVGFIAKGPVDLRNIPSAPQALLASASAVVAPPGDLSLFQARLPPALAEIERVQMWLKDPSVAETLGRLASSESKAVPAAVLEGFALPAPTAAR